MTNQELLLKQIRKRQAPDASLIDAIATVLQVSYDAAHRRVSLKSRFSIDETITLCTHFGISMDSLFRNDEVVLTRKTAEIRTPDDMARYLKESAQNIGMFATMNGARMFYSAKDIPLFHMVGGTLLSKFKIYVWLNLLSGEGLHSRFEDFTVSVPLLEHGEALRKVYNSLEVHEIWNDTTINSTLQQLYYFYKSGLLSLNSAALLCADLAQVLTDAETRCCKEGSRYHLYYNELLILNNNVLITAPQKQSLFVPYTLLGYFITDDAATCSNTERFFGQQIKNSMLLNSSGARDRKVFFNRGHQKIESYLQRMRTESETGF
ncbi:hypothetical protein ACLI1A_18160 [Flavobacterium sp. RHBU_3]|uniref:hypothetical protein n=1 Tax=Flavobacterium sp. RHBU_3 TaxID=3391184 RepID=UPI00398462B2